MNLSTIQKGLEQETQFSENVSAKDRLMRNLHLASNIKSCKGLGNLFSGASFYS